MPATEAAPAPEPAPAKEAAKEAEAAPAKEAAAPEAIEYPLLLHTVVVRDAAAALKWYAEALDAKTAFRYDDADGRVMHAVMRTSYGMMLGVEDHYPKMHMVAPATDGDVAGKDGAAAKGCSYVYVTIPVGKGSADQAVERMREKGATVVSECEDKFYGQRMGQVVDPYGVAWVFAHKIEPKGKGKEGEAVAKPAETAEKAGAEGDAKKE